MELVVTIAVAGIVISTGIPQLNELFRNNRMVSNTNELVTGLHLARSEAVRRNRSVVICKSDDVSVAEPICSSTTTGGWEKGWFVFEDINGDHQYQPATEGDVLRVNIGALGKAVTINTSSASSGASIDDYVAYTVRGVPQNGQSGVFKICDDRGFKNTAGNVIARGIVVPPSGRVRATREADEIGACP